MKLWSYSQVNRMLLYIFLTFCLCLGIGSIFYVVRDIVTGIVFLFGLASLAGYIWLYRKERSLEREVNKALNLLWLKKAKDQDIHLVIDHDNNPTSLFYQDHNYCTEGKKASHQIIKIEYSDDVILYLVNFGNDDPRNFYIVNETLERTNLTTVYIKK